MKPAPFTLALPKTLPEAQDALRDPDARIIAGGQSLGAMLNLRLTQPARLVPIANLPELSGAAADATAVTIGATVTHAAIADGRTPDLEGAILAEVAGNIAYRAVRNRGTIGGSVCHADPAADWLTVLIALGASVVISSNNAPRALAVQDFITGAFRTALGPGDILHSIRIPRPSPTARWGYIKACRKPGEFAHAMAAVLIDGETRRLVIGATGGKPVLLTGANAAPEAAHAALADSGLDAITSHMQCVIVRRAFERATA